MQVWRFQHPVMVEKHTKQCPTRSDNVKAAAGLHFPGHGEGEREREREAERRMAAPSLFPRVHFAAFFFLLALSLAFNIALYHLVLLSHPLSPSSFSPALFNPFAFSHFASSQAFPPSLLASPFTRSVSPFREVLFSRSFSPGFSPLAPSH